MNKYGIKIFKYKITANYNINLNAIILTLDERKAVIEVIQISSKFPWALNAVIIHHVYSTENCQLCIPGFSPGICIVCR